MKEQETVEKFIQLRAENKSYDKISKLLKVSKPTLIGWGKKQKANIDKLKSIRLEQILEKYKLTQEDRITRLAKELKLAWDSFEKKDYDSLSKREIILIIMRLEQSLRKEPAIIANEEDVDDGDIQVNVVRSIITAEDMKKMKNSELRE